MADDIATISFSNDTLTDANGNTATLTGTVQVDYTTKSYQGNYRLSGPGLSVQGSFNNSGGLAGSNGQYTIGDGSLTVSYAGEYPSTAASETYSSFGTRYAGVNQPLTTVACYVGGTLIRTPKGDVPVEALAIGDLVVTASGAHRPIRWLGRRRYLGRFVNANPDILPVCFKTGSLAENVPVRDLWVSPKHAMYVDGALVPAEHLVNGLSIIKARRVEQVDYHHVELDSHDVLLAEGAPSESFVEDADRQMFQNAREHAALYPDAVRTEALYCAPRLEHGFALESIRRRLDARAAMLEDPKASAA